jgi:hypothetical protein
MHTALSAAANRQFSIDLPATGAIQRGGDKCRQTNLRAINTIFSRALTVKILLDGQDIRLNIRTTIPGVPHADS